MLADGAELTDELAAEIRRRIRTDCSPRHVPDELVPVAAVPRTLSGKVLEVPIKKILMGDDPATAASRESLANPEAYDWFVAYARERRARLDGPARSNSAAWPWPTPMQSVARP